MSRSCAVSRVIASDNEQCRQRLNHASKATLLCFSSAALAWACSKAACRPKKWALAALAAPRVARLTSLLGKSVDGSAVRDQPRPCVTPPLTDCFDQRRLEALER